MKKKYLNIYTITAAIFLIIFIFVVKDIFTYEIISYDKAANDFFINNLRNNEITLFMRIITGFGSFIFITAIFIVLLLLYKNRKTIYYVLINTITIFLINDFIKHIVGRSRPSGINLVNESSYSFPSSHSMSSVVFYGLLIYLIHKNVNDKRIKWILIFILSIITSLICISRVYLGAHYLSDVIGGIALAIIYLMIFLMMNKDFEKKV